MQMPADDPQLHGQAAEIELLAALAPELHTRATIDVGAERGGTAAALLHVGYGPLSLIEANPDSAAELRVRFADHDNVAVHELAAGADDGDTLLRRAHDPSGRARPEFATTLELAPAPDLTWDSGVPVPRRSLTSLAESGELPRQVGLLKIDTEGADLDVLSGARGLRAEVVVAELWLDLPDSLGPCPYDADQLAQAAAVLGATRMLWFRHSGVHTAVIWDVADLEAGEWGNVVFLADHLLEAARTAIEPIRERLARDLERRALRLHSELSARAIAQADAGAEQRMLAAEAAKREAHLVDAGVEQRMLAAEVAKREARLVDAHEAAVAHRERLVEMKYETTALRERAQRAEREAAELRRLLAATQRRELIVERQNQRLTDQLGWETSKHGGTMMQRAGHRARHARHRARHTRVQVTSPRIGVLWQTAPEALRVPASYLEAHPPEPAPTLSIVTPTFRGADYLERTMRSVLEQGYPALEYVVQDGGSDDGAVEIIKRYDQRLASWESGPDQGQTHALNLGFARTSGELMAYLNDDDLLLPGAIAYATSYLQAHPEVDVVYGQRVLIDHNGHRVGLWVTPPHDDEMLRHVDYVPQETMFWRRRIWETAGATFDESFEFAMDWDLLLRFREAGARFARLPRLMGAFRVLPEQKTQSLAEIGERDCMRLRERHTGRALTNVQAFHQIRPYLRRSVAHHLAFRARERLERNWAYVDAGPLPPAAD